jgi:FkbM family methyltransferase
MRDLARLLVSKITSVIAKTPLKRVDSLRQIKTRIDRLILPNEKTWIDYRGYELLVDPTDYLGAQLWTYGKYEPEVEGIIGTHLEEGNVAFDIGANIGQFTICMRDAVGKTGAIYSFEPLSKNRNLLNCTLNRNGISNVKVINKAVGEAHDMMELFVDESNTGRSTLHPNEEYDKKLQIDIIPLSDYTKSFDSIQFIKVDVEGAELDVIKGLEDEIRKVEYIFVEIHQHTEYHKEYDIEELFAILNSNGSIFAISAVPKYESIKKHQKVQTADELSKCSSVIWARDDSPSKIE